jgi:hypothetical protein
MYAHLENKIYKFYNTDVPFGYFNLHVRGCVFTGHVKYYQTTYTYCFSNTIN